MATLTADMVRYGVSVDGTVLYMAAAEPEWEGEPDLSGMVSAYREINPDSEIRVVEVSRFTFTLPHPDVPCAWCGRYVMGEEASFNAQDICVECAGEDI